MDVYTEILLFRHDKVVYMNLQWFWLHAQDLHEINTEKSLCMERGGAHVVLSWTEQLLPTDDSCDRESQTFFFNNAASNKATYCGVVGLISMQMQSKLCGFNWFVKKVKCVDLRRKKKWEEQIKNYKWLNVGRSDQIVLYTFMEFTTKREKY